MRMIEIPGKGYEISETVVTQLQWYRVMGTQPWSGTSYVREGDNYPAVYVNWYDARDFCRALSKKDGKTYRLPKEDEWEYACSGGVNTEYHFGNNPEELDKYAWFYNNTINEQYPHGVAQKLPNQFGLYDMHGNVWEWCDGLYNNEEPEYLVLRGGSWNSFSDYCSAWCRDYDAPEYRCIYVGFRLARTL